jgi:hypothetical protein
VDFESLLPNLIGEFSPPKKDIPDTSERDIVIADDIRKQTLVIFWIWLVKRKGNSLFGLGMRPRQKEMMRSHTKTTPVERLRQWQQHAVSQMRVQRGDFVLISITAHPLDQTK